MIEKCNEEILRINEAAEEAGAMRRDHTPIPQSGRSYVPAEDLFRRMGVNMQQGGRA